MNNAMQEPQPTIANVRRPPHPVFWVIAAALVAIAAGEWFRRPDGRFDAAAFAQTVNSGGARGIFAFSGQLSKSTYGIFMVDVDAMTLWAYEYQPEKRCLRFAAARTWRYDRYLENYNGCDLPPDAVERMVDDQREYRIQSAETQQLP